jgi:hypothetical protein
LKQTGNSLLSVLAFCQQNPEIRDYFTGPRFQNTYESNERRHLKKFRVNILVLRSVSEYEKKFVDPYSNPKKMNSDPQHCLAVGWGEYYGCKSQEIIVIYPQDDLY